MSGEDRYKKFNIDDVNKIIADESKKPILTGEETNAAKKELIISYPKIKRHIIDPPLKHKCKTQKYGLFSWYPSKGAKPDINDIYGIIIMRGSYKTPDDAQARAEFLIKTEDSKHEYFIAEIGAEKPLCVDNKYVNDLKIVEKEVDKAKKEQDEKYKEEQENAKKEMEARKKALEEDAKKDPNEVNIDYYITQLTKLSNMNQHINEQREELKKCLNIVKNTRKIVNDLEKEHPDYRSNFINRMKATFEERGIPVDIEKVKANFENILKISSETN